MSKHNYSRKRPCSPFRANDTFRGYDIDRSFDSIQMPPPPSRPNISFSNNRGLPSNSFSARAPPFSSASSRRFSSTNLPSIPEPQSIVDPVTKRTTIVLDDDPSDFNGNNSGFVIDRQRNSNRVEPQVERHHHAPPRARGVTFAVDHHSMSSTQRSARSSFGSDIATSAITFHETNHGRERRLQRAVPTRDIQEAMKYGRKIQHPHNPNLLIYKHNGKEHIVTRDSSSLVTTMVKTIHLNRKYVTERERYEHDQALAHIHGIRNVEHKCNFNSTNMRKLKSEVGVDDEEEDDYFDTNQGSTKWMSHSVIIVDRSGSMGKSDVNGSRTRFSAVWLSLAQDYIEQRMNAGSAGLYDVVSIVLMGEKAKLLIDRWPTSKVLFNKIVDLFYESERADQIWKNPKRMRHDQAILKTLVRPFGHGCYGPSLLLAEKLLEKNDDESCALSLLLLSDGRPSDWSVFKQDREESRKILKEATGRMASKFGRRLTFSTIGMGSRTEFETLEALVEAARDFGGNGSFSVPSLSSAAVGRAISSVASSLTATQTEIKLRGQSQRRVRPCIRENKKLIPLLTEAVTADEFDIYMNDDVEHYEYQSCEDGTKKFVQSPLQHPDAAGVAMKRQAFGEGQERFAFQFFEVAKDGCTVVGPPLVSKESRFIHESADGQENWEARDKFAKRFCKVQMSARNAAIEFNKKLDSIKNLDPDTARVNFLNCSIYYLTHPEKGQFSVIVERKLNGTFQKWNNNNGWHIGRDRKKPSGRITLDTVREVGNNETIGTEKDPIEIDNGIFVKKEDVAQAFSHFSYVHSGKKMLICDLQGVYDRSGQVFNFTDPVIHYHDAKKESKRNRGVYGRTDMGQKGIQNFFRTHECNCLCDLITKGFIGVS